MERLAPLPYCTFYMERISNGTYRLQGRHTFGGTFRLSGIDPEKLFQAAKAFAERSEESIRDNSSNGPETNIER
jgi:hypothetical protein